MDETRNLQHGPIAFVGDGVFASGADFHKEFLDIGANEVVVLPTGAAYEQPDRVVEELTSRFRSLGGSVRPVLLFSRTDAEDESLAAILRDAPFIYLAGSSSLHTRAVLKESAAFHAIVSAWHNGAAVVGASGGATIFTDPMVDPRGGALTVGLGLVRDVAVTLHPDTSISSQLRRTLSLAPEGLPVVALGEDAALIRDPDGTWKTDGSGVVTLYLDGKETELSVLAGKPVL